MGEGSGEGRGGLGAEPGQVQHGSRVPEKVLFAQEPSQVQQDSGKGSGEGLGGFGAEPGGSTGFRRTFRRRSGKAFGAEPGQQGSGEGSGEGLGGLLAQRQVSFNRVPEKVVEKVWEALVQSQVRFNRVPEKVPARSGSTGFRRRFRRGSGKALVQSEVNRVPEKVPEKVWEALVQSQVRRMFRRRSQRLWCRVRSSSTGFEGSEKVWEALVQSQVRFNKICGHLIHGNPAEVFPPLGFAARFRKMCENKTMRVLGNPLIFLKSWYVLGLKLGCVYVPRFKKRNFQTSLLNP